MKKKVSFFLFMFGILFIIIALFICIYNKYNSDDNPLEESSEKIIEFNNDMSDLTKLYNCYLNFGQGEKENYTFVYDDTTISFDFLNCLEKEEKNGIFTYRLKDELFAKFERINGTVEDYIEKNGGRVDGERVYNVDDSEKGRIIFRWSSTEDKSSKITEVYYAYKIDDNSIFTVYIKTFLDLEVGFIRDVISSINQI